MFIAAGLCFAAVAAQAAVMAGQQGSAGSLLNQYQKRYQENTAGANARIGVVTARDGFSITMDSAAIFVGSNAATKVQYTVDATNANIYGVNGTTTIDSITTGDRISVRGSLNGTTIAATEIRKTGNVGTANQNPDANRGVPQLLASGVFYLGEAGAISGNALTLTMITRRDGNATTTTIYTVDASNAKIYVNNATSTIASIAAGDRIAVRGTLSGTAIAAIGIWKGNYMGGAVSEIRQEREREENRFQNASSTQNFGVKNWLNWRNDPVLADQVRQLIAQMQEQIKSLMQQLKDLLAKKPAVN